MWGVRLVVVSLTLGQDDISRWGCEGCEQVLSFLMSSDVRDIRHANTQSQTDHLNCEPQSATRHLPLSLSLSYLQSDPTNKQINRKLSEAFLSLSHLKLDET